MKKVLYGFLCLLPLMCSGETPEREVELLIAKQRGDIRLIKNEIKMKQNQECRDLLSQVEKLEFQKEILVNLLGNLEDFKKEFKPRKLAECINVFYKNIQQQPVQDCFKRQFESQDTTGTSQLKEALKNALKPKFKCPNPKKVK